MVFTDSLPGFCDALLLMDLGGLPEKAGLPAVELGERIPGYTLSPCLDFDDGLISGKVAGT